MVSTVDEKARLPTAASAETMTTPAVRRAGGVTTNVAVADLPLTSPRGELMQETMSNRQGDVVAPCQ